MSVEGQPQNHQEKVKRHIADSQTTSSKIMQPEHANHLGNVHGGVLMKTIDEVGALCASRHARRPAVTVAVDSMTFEEPVHVGDAVIFDARMTYTGKKSMEVEIHVEVENIETRERKHTNQAFAVYVALDTNNRPMVVPELILDSDEERKRFEEGKKRQADRLSRKKKI